jgi:hypothetical protein
VPCKNPVVWSSTPGASMDVCVEHSLSKSTDYPNAKYINHSSGTAILNGSTVYTKAGDIIGRYSESNNKLLMFKNIKPK